MNDMEALSHVKEMSEEDIMAATDPKNWIIAEKAHRAHAIFGMSGNIYREGLIWWGDVIMAMCVRREIIKSRKKGEEDAVKRWQLFLDGITEAAFQPLIWMPYPNDKPKKVGDYIVTRFHELAQKAYVCHDTVYWDGKFIVYDDEITAYSKMPYPYKKDAP